MSRSRPTLSPRFVAAVVALLLTAFVVPSDGPGWLAGIRGWVVAVAFVALLFEVGGLTLRWCGPVAGRGAEGPVARATMGFFVVSAGSGVLAAFGGLNRHSAAFLFAATALLLIRAGRSSPAEASGALSGAASIPPRIRLVVGIGLIALLAPYLVQTLVPDSDWDGAMYHLPMATAMLEHGLWTDQYPLAAQYRPGAVHVVYATLIALGGESAILPLNLLAILGALAGIWALVEPSFGRGAAALAVLCGLTVNLLLELGLDVRVDAFLVFFVVAGLAALLAWQRDATQTGAALVAAMAASLALGTKYNGLPYAALLLAVGGLLLLRGGVPQRAKVAALAICVLLPGGFWYARNAALFGDPVYPLRQGPMHRDAAGTLVRRKLAPLIPDTAAPGPGSVAEVQRLRQGGPTERKRAAASPWILVEALWERDKFTTKPYHWVSPFLLLFVLLPLVSRGPPAWLLFGFGIVGYILLFANTHVLRYGAPLCAVFAAGAGVVLGAVRPVWARAGIVAALVGWAGYHSSAEWGKVAALQPMRYLDGSETELQYLSRVGYNGEPAMPRFVRWFNDQVEAGVAPPDGKVFMIGEAKGHRLAVDYSPGTGSAGKEWLIEMINADWDYARAHTALRARGFQWILLNKGWMEWVMRNRIARPTRMALTLHHLSAFLREYGTNGNKPLVEFGPLMVFRLVE